PVPGPGGRPASSPGARSAHRRGRHTGRSASGGARLRGGRASWSAPSSRRSGWPWQARRIRGGHRRGSWDHNLAARCVRSGDRRGTPRRPAAVALGGFGPSGTAPSAPPRILSCMSDQSPPPPSGPGRPQRGPGAGGGNGGREHLPRWVFWVAAAAIIAMFALPSLRQGDNREEIGYSEFQNLVAQEKVGEVTWNNNNGSITGTLDDGTEFRTNGPVEPPQKALDLLEEHGVTVRFETPQSSFLEAILPVLLPVSLLIGFFWLMQCRAQSQMGGVMSIGRSKAKTYSTERPGTTFADVAGYQGVKQEIREVVDFLRHPERFAEIGARIPKGVLLVGPPGTGKTLIARAVAGEAGVPFLSVTGTDFMEDRKGTRLNS